MLFGDGAAALVISNKGEEGALQILDYTSLRTASTSTIWVFDVQVLNLETLVNRRTSRHEWLVSQ
jgi:3-oxoacyl-[acyl-carrier-protein] synthase III